MLLSNETIARTLVVPTGNVNLFLPFIEAALQEQSINSPMVQVAALATIKTETPRFAPVKEVRADQEKNPDLWKLQERYWPSGYYGRGFIQLTWKSNYRTYGDVLGVDLINNPDLALTPEIAARVLALYFKNMRIDIAADSQDWTRVRKLVNGGTHNLSTFNSAVQGLLRAMAGGPTNDN